MVVELHPFAYATLSEKLLKNRPSLRHIQWLGICRLLWQTPIFYHFLL